MFTRVCWLRTTTASLERRAAPILTVATTSRPLFALTARKLPYLAGQKWMSQQPAVWRQKTLNKAFGLPLEQIQPRLDSLFRRQAATTATASSTSMSGQAKMQIDANGSSKDVKVEAAPSSDVEEVASTSKAVNGIFEPLRYLSEAC